MGMTKVMLLEDFFVNNVQEELDMGENLDWLVAVLLVQK